MSEKTFQPTDIKPHMVRAMYNWISENDTKTYITFVYDHNVSVDIPVPPAALVKQDITVLTSDVEGLSIRALDTITINTHPDAVLNFCETDDGYSFKCRFNGNVASCYVPFVNIVGISGQHTGLSHQIPYSVPGDTRVPVEPEAVAPKKPNHLSVVK